MQAESLTLNTDNEMEYINFQYTVKEYSKSCKASFVMVLAQITHTFALSVLVSFGKFLLMLAGLPIMYLGYDTYRNA